MVGGGGEALRSRGGQADRSPYDSAQRSCQLPGPRRAEGGEGRKLLLYLSSSLVFLNFKAGDLRVVFPRGSHWAVASGFAPLRLKENRG